MERAERKRLDWLFLFIVSSVLTVFAWLVIGFSQDYRSIPAQHLIGNRSSTVAALKQEGFPFSFLVIGDTTGKETAETLIGMALQEGEPSFMVILGDFVRRPDIWNHRFFLTEMTSELRPSFPVFLVAGNHDVDYASRKVTQAERRVTREVYESLYGAMHFDFVFNECLFAVCGIDLNRPTDSLAYLRNVLSIKGEGRKHIFVFVHYPPKGLAEHIEGSLPISHTEFFSLLESHKVTSCFFGDYHGYWRGQRKGVNYIVTGGGGRLKQWQPEWGKFHHILKVTVDHDRIAEQVVTTQGDLGLEDRLEERVFTFLFPIVQNRFWILYFIFAIFLIGSGYSAFRLFRIVR